MKFVIRIFALSCSGLVLGLLLSTNAVGQTIIKARPLQVFSTGGGDVVLQAPGTLTTYALTLPGAGPSANQILMADASGNFTWITFGSYLPLSGGTLTGALTATSFTGNGASLTSLSGGNITSGTITGTQIASNTVAPANLTSSSGTASATTFYRGDGAWATPSGGGGGGSQVALYDATSTKLGTLISITRNNATILTSAGYVVVVLMTPVSGFDFPINQIDWTGSSCSGTPYLNSGNGAGILDWANILCFSGQTGSLYYLSGANANGVASSVTFTGASIENPTCMSPGTNGGWALTAITQTAAGLPATITYPLSIH